MGLVDPSGLLAVAHPCTNTQDILNGIGCAQIECPSGWECSGGGGGTGSGGVDYYDPPDGGSGGGGGSSGDGGNIEDCTDTTNPCRRDITGSQYSEAIPESITSIIVKTYAFDHIRRDHNERDPNGTKGVFYSEFIASILDFQEMILIPALQNTNSVVLGADFSTYEIRYRFPQPIGYSVYPTNTIRDVLIVIAKDKPNPNPGAYFVVTAYPKD